MYPYPIRDASPTGHLTPSVPAASSIFDDVGPSHPKGRPRHSRCLSESLVAEGIQNAIQERLMGEPWFAYQQNEEWIRPVHGTDTEVLTVFEMNDSNGFTERGRHADFECNT